jgi:hypothetical protein
VQSRSQTAVSSHARATPWTARVAALAVLALAAPLAGCEPYVEGNGVRGEETRSVSAFGGLAISDGIQAIVTVGAADQSVRIEGDQNVLQYLETTVEGRPLHGPVLVVDTDPSYRSNHPLKVTVAVPALAYVAAIEASPVAVTGAASDAFTVEASDGSNVSLAGAGGTRLVVMLGGGQHGGARLDARAYPVQQADVTVSEGAVASVRASAAVQGSAAGAGTRVENSGDGVCAVTASGGAEVVCAGP